MRDRFPFLDVLDAHSATFIREALAIPAEDFVPMPSETYQGEWKAFPLFLGPWAHEFGGVNLAHNRARCPDTVAVLDKIEGLGVAGFMRLAPGAHIELHTDFRRDDEVRCHVGLVLPEVEWATWPPGTAQLLDVRKPHSVRNDTTRPRLTLLLDVRLPFILEPDMTPDRLPEIAGEVVRAATADGKSKPNW